MGAFRCILKMTYAPAMVDQARTPPSGYAMESAMGTFSSSPPTCTLTSPNFSSVNWPVELGVDRSLLASTDLSASNSSITGLVRFFSFGEGCERGWKESYAYLYGF